MKKFVSIYKALGDEVRLAIIDMLLGKELCVCDINDACEISQPAVSHHLKILKNAGLLEDRREGKWIFYRINHETFKLTQSYFRKILEYEDELIRYYPCSSNRLAEDCDEEIKK
ncbi:MAG TPA: metalloregulator ArsR/SmtB family transcription factor [Methylomusa anaerophila]|uniref:HTH-type transcriptional repressor AseR n=1 Tax=Methylomusa anaerophila TaxID=1930071 RepID=A0A348AGE8_9FIRM|nr:metalloregulator ArsR/SmtB family transcription factor [Methylomusa anaerophila]BBB90146.1 HTH-type transcriptional repressor AseR [Methylomusa anaerophila]HML88130.1 metalloregulator ArsR/SmtB family transcription factor [Methylomusa anaerophila]